MAYSIVNNLYHYNLAVQFCQEVLKQSGPQHFQYLFQSLLNNKLFAPSFKYFSTEDAYNFFICYPQVFIINDYIVSLNTQPLINIQPGINIQNDLSNHICKIREEQTEASDIGISQNSKKVSVNKVYGDISKTFYSDVSEITELPLSLKTDLINSIYFLLRSVHPLNLKYAFKTLLYIVESASSNFLDLSETEKQMFVKAVCNGLKAKLRKTSKPNKCKFRTGVLLLAIYLLIERREISFLMFTKIWKKLNIHTKIPKNKILSVLKTSEFIVMDETHCMSLSPSFERVNSIVESYSQLISQNCLCENWNSNESERDLHYLNAVGIDCDIESTDPNKDRNAFNCTKVLSDVLVLSSQSNQEGKQKSVKKEQHLPHPMKMSEADNSMETTPFKKTATKIKTPEKTLMTDKKFSFDESGKKLLEHSFFIIRKYFKHALPNHILLSSLLASKNVCKNFALLPIEDQCNYLERCYCSIIASHSLPTDSDSCKLRKSTLVEERDLLSCYLVVKSGGIHYTELIKLLKKFGTCVSKGKGKAGRYFQNFCKYISFSKKGFLTLRPPFSGIKRSLKNVSAFPSNYEPSYACPDNNSLCFQGENENKDTSPVMFSSSSRGFHNHAKDSLNFEVDETTEKEPCLDQKMLDAKDFLSSQPKHVDEQISIEKEQDLIHPMRSDNIMETSPF